MPQYNNPIMRSDLIHELNTTQPCSFPIPHYHATYTNPAPSKSKTALRTMHFTLNQTVPRFKIHSISQKPATRTTLYATKLLQGTTMIHYIYKPTTCLTQEPRA